MNSPMKFARRLVLALALTSAALSARGLSSAGETAIDKICRAHRLDCLELKQAVESVAETGKLPGKWITKRQAKELGWSPGVKLGKVAPGKSIGGDRFGNREKRLPLASGRVYFEADLNYRGGKRGAHRLIYSSDRMIYVTVDHYKTFENIPK